MNHQNNFLKVISPFQLLVLGYLVITTLGAFLLSCPIATKNNQWQNYLDALFVASSAISTSGLTVVDIGSFYTIFGQIVLMIIFQIGGIGYMTLLMFVLYLFDVKTSLSVQITAKESLSGPTLKILGKFFTVTIIFTLLFEIGGALILSLFWLQYYDGVHAIYYGLFHSISAFCTAGFSLFPDSLMNYRNSVVINIIINGISLAGGIGFIVLFEIVILIKRKYHGIKRKSLSIHSKLVLVTTFIIIIAGTMLLLFATPIFSANVLMAEGV